MIQVPAGGPTHEVFEGMGMPLMSAVLVGLVFGAFVPILRVLILIRARRLLHLGYDLGFDADEETLEYVGKVVSVIYGLIFIAGVFALDMWTVRADDILGEDHRRVPDWFSNGFSLTHSQAGALLISFMVAVLIGNRLIERVSGSVTTGTTHEDPDRPGGGRARPRHGGEHTRA